MNSTDLRTWHEIRARNIGGSEVAALFGVQPDYALSHYALWQVKSGRIAAPEVNGPRPRWGLKLQDVIAAAVEEQEGWLTEPCPYMTHPTVKGMGGTPDYRIIEGAPGKDGPGILETKNTDWLIHRRQWGAEPPIHAGLQLQHYLAVSGCQWGAVACLVGGNELKVYPFERRPKIIAAIEERVAAFWRSIERDRPPPVDGTDSTADAIRALYPEPIREVADLSADNELPVLCADFLHAAAERKAAERREQEKKSAIFAKLAGHVAARCSGFWVNVSVTPDNPGRAVTEADLGTIIGARKGSRRLSIKEATS